MRRAALGSLYFSAPNRRASFSISSRTVGDSPVDASIALRAYSFALDLSPVTR